MQPVSPWTPFPFATVGGFGAGALANGVARFVSAASNLQNAAGSEEILSGFAEFGGSLLEGGALGGAAGLGAGAVIGVLTAGGIYVYEKYHH